MHIGEVEGHALSCLPPKGILEAPTARDSGARRAGPGEGVPARTRQLERGMDPTERVPPDGRVRVGQARGGLRVADAKRTQYRGARRAGRPDLDSHLRFALNRARGMTAFEGPFSCRLQRVTTVLR